MDKSVYLQWFEKGENDLSEAEFLLKHDRPLEDVALFIQQSAEKYLKGFLISVIKLIILSRYDGIHK